MKATYVNFWRAHPGQRESALSYFAKVKETVEGIGVSNVRFRMVMTGENTGLYFGMYDLDSPTEYGRILDRSESSPEMQSLMAEMDQKDSPLTYQGNWVMTEVARSGDDTGDERAFIIRNWNVTPGREADFFESFKQVSALMRQHGGVHLVYRIAFGGDMSGVYTAVVGFPDFESLYAFHEYSATSEEGRRIVRDFHKGTPPATSRSISTAKAVPIHAQVSTNGMHALEQISEVGC